jgi:hypothetical protein
MPLRGDESYHQFGWQSGSASAREADLAKYFVRLTTDQASNRFARSAISLETPERLPPLISTVLTQSIRVWCELPIFAATEGKEAQLSYRA